MNEAMVAIDRIYIIFPRYTYLASRDTYIFESIVFSWTIKHILLYNRMDYRVDFNSHAIVNSENSLKFESSFAAVAKLVERRWIRNRSRYQTWN